MHGLGTPDRLCTGLGQREVTNLPLFDEARHGTYRIFDGYAAIDAMQPIDVDLIYAEPFQTLVTRVTHVVRVPARERRCTSPFTSGECKIAELGRDHELRALTFDRFCNELFVDTIAICVRRDQQ